MGKPLSRLMMAIGLGLVASGTADAQTYPSRPITLVVPQASGGGTTLWLVWSLTG
jgi:tripartite-type tricarboxylate transporter receptor subunit TctC